MKAICKVFTVLLVLAGLLMVVAALVAEEQKPEYIRLFGEPEDQND